MPTFQEDVHLQEAIKTTVAQLCKLGLPYQTEVIIEGTVGLTIDKKRVVLVHFEEKVVNVEGHVESTQCAPSQSQIGGLVTSQSQCTAATNLPSSTQAANQDTEVCNLRLIGAEALSSLHEILSRPIVSQTREPGQEKSWQSGKDRPSFPETPSKMLTLNETIAIDLDSDTESFSGMTFDDMEEVKVKGGLLGKRTNDVKNIIVIDDNDLFDSTSDPMEGTYSQDSYGAMSDNLRSNLSQQACTSEAGVETSTANVPVDTLATASSMSGSNGAESTSVTPRSPPQLKTSFECEACAKTLPTQSLLEAHLVAAHDITESPMLGKISHHTCSRCGKKFRFQASLNKHEIKHMGAKPHRCKICQNSYRFKSSLDIHVNVHKNCLKCNACNKDYNNKKLFQKHIVYMHEKPTARLQNSSGE